MPGEIERTRWLDEALEVAGRPRTGPVEAVRHRPWGSVWKIATGDQVVFLKEPAPATAFEIALYEVLVRVAPERVLHPIALEPRWLVLPDGGPVLSDGLAPDEILERLPGVVGQYAELQLALAPHVDELLDLGVADMRPARMPQRFDEALAGARPSTRDEVEGLARVAALRDAFRSWCDRLAAAPPAVTLDHNDLHGGNVFLDGDGGARFFDWGDAVVSHPFASALVLRSVVRWLQDVDAETPAERRITDAYLEPFTGLGSRGEQREALDVACEVGKVARSLVWARAVAPMLPEAEDPEEFRTAPVRWLLELLEGPLAGGVQGSAHG